MDYLLFQLQAPIAAWGETAVGEFRPSANYPSESALLGLLAAALGIYREDSDAHMALRNSYGFAVGVLKTGHLLRDYHTSQVPGRVALKHRPHHTRRDELNMPKEDLNTILSTRDYRQDARSLVAVQSNGNAPYTLEQLAEAITKPRFTLYFGRKACPPSAPLFPRIHQANQADTALELYAQELQEIANQLGEENIRPFERLVWGEGINIDRSWDIEVLRKDRVLSRRGWQFSDRKERIALIGEG